MITHVTSSEQPDGRVLLRWEISNNAFQEDVQECLNAGMNAHIAKPMDVVKAERIIAKAVAGVRPPLES